MRVAVFSDVHGNLAALEAVLEDIAGQGVDAAVFAGDLCFFGPQPGECVARLQDWRGSSIYGNTDEWLVGRVEPPEMRRELVAWTVAQLNNQQRAWLAELPFELRFMPTDDAADGLLIVHANPLDVNQIIFPGEAEQLERYGRVRQADSELEPLLGDTAEEIVAFGHLHLPSVRHAQGKRLVNISSVSIPGDGDGRAKYGLFTWDGRGWSFERFYVPFAVGQFRQAYLHQQPPGWRDFVTQIEQQGFVAQNV